MQGWRVSHDGYSESHGTSIPGAARNFPLSSIRPVDSSPYEAGFVHFPRGMRRESASRRSLCGWPDVPETRAKRACLASARTLNLTIEGPMGDSPTLHEWNKEIHATRPPAPVR